MERACELMTPRPYALREDDTLDDVLARAQLSDVRCLPVVRGRKLVGLLTQEELVRLGARRDPRSGGRVTAGAVMRREVRTVGPQAPAAEVIRLLRDEKLTCVPVVSKLGVLLGIITAYDLLRVAAERVEELERRETAAAYDE